MMNMTQRLPRYELLLRELEKLSNKMLVTQATGAEPSAEKELQEAVQAALENLRERTASMNSGVGDAERRQRAMQVARDVLKLEDLAGDTHAEVTSTFTFPYAPIVGIDASEGGHGARVVT